MLRRRFKGVAVRAALALTLVLAAAGCRVNPVTGDKQVIFFGTEQELALGDNYHPNIVYMYDGEYIDPALKNYLGTIVMRLNACSHRRQTRVDFTVLNTSMYNAFAIPGHVYCTRGFLAKLETEAQFAAVMGHELGHVAALHTARQMTTNVLTAVGFAVVQGAAGDSAAGKGVMALGQASITLLGLSYSREQERQADRVGTYYMALGGWDPRQAIAMQKLLHSLNEHEPSTVDKYLSTHPPMNDRLKEIKAVIQEKRLLESDLIQGDGVYAERWNRWMERVRQVNRDYEPYDRGLRLLQKGKPQEALQAAEQALERRTDQAPFYRLKGDALLALNRPTEARNAYLASLSRDGRYVLARVGLGQVALSQNNFGEAEQQFAAVVTAYPSSLMGHYGLGVARFQQQKWEAAVQPLQQVTAAAPKEPVPHYLLAICYEKGGQYPAALQQYQLAVNTGLQGDARANAISRIQAIQAALQQAQQQQQQ